MGSDAEQCSAAARGRPCARLGAFSVARPGGVVRCPFRFARHATNRWPTLRPTRQRPRSDHRKRCGGSSTGAFLGRLSDLSDLSADWIAVAGHPHAPVVANFAMTSIE